MLSLVPASEVTTVLLDDVGDSEVTTELVSVLDCSDVSIDVNVVVRSGTPVGEVNTVAVDNSDGTGDEDGSEGTIGLA